MAFYWKDHPESAGRAETMVQSAIQERGMTIREVSIKTGIPYYKLQISLNGKRHLRVEEFLTLCALLKLDPRMAAE